LKIESWKWVYGCERSPAPNFQFSILNDIGPGMRANATKRVCRLNMKKTWESSFKLVRYIWSCFSPLYLSSPLHPRLN